MVSLPIGKFVAIVIMTDANIVRGCFLDEQYVFLVALGSSRGSDDDEGESDKL